MAAAPTIHDMEALRFLVVGAGSRGLTYARLAAAGTPPVRITGVAEPRTEYRQRLADEFHIPADARKEDGLDFVPRADEFDAVIIATPDQAHTEPAIAFARTGTPLLLEKPMAPTESECRAIVQTALEHDCLLAVCHVLRYTDITRRLNTLLAEGAIGDLVSLQRLEPVGYWHFAHSYVRGNWRREEDSSSILMAKSCHDLDWIRAIMNRPCRSVSSFGSLLHFRRDQAPAGAGTRCLHCDVEPACPYSAPKIYLGAFDRGCRDWPLDVLTPDVTREALTEALERGPYGRCVYDLDNDVPDHQVVNMEFEGGATASFTLTAFTPMDHRKTRLFGTRGMIEDDGEELTVTDFLTDETRRIEGAAAGDASAAGGHGGGDTRLVQAFVRAVAEGDAGPILSGPGESLESHLMVFAAEKARHQRTVVHLRD